MVFGALSDLDINFNEAEETLNLEKNTFWFTLFLGTTVKKDKDGDDIINYEYVSFPSYLEGPEHLFFMSTLQPYCANSTKFFM